MSNAYIKWSFLGIIVLQIASIFYLLNVYDKFADNPENFYKNILISQKQAAEEN